MLGSFFVHQILLSSFGKKDQMCLKCCILKKQQHSFLKQYKNEGQKIIKAFLFFFLNILFLYFSITTLIMDTTCPILNDGTTAIQWIYVSISDDMK